MKLAIIGSGYVGLVAGACFADTGNDVICVDNNPAKIEQLLAGKMPIYEPGLDELVTRNVREGRLAFTTDLPTAVRDSEVVFIAVGTPQYEDGSADLTHVLAVAEAIGKAMDGYKIVVDKSTVPVGTAARVKQVIQSVTSHEVDVVSNPEFLKEGAAIDDFLRPDRVVVGVDSERAGKVMRELYSPFVRTNKPILVMDVLSAEMTKYAANAMLALRVSFMNEVANLCELSGADINQVRIGIGTDNRIGMSFLFPGCGYGGSCFPKDVQALIRTGYDFGMEMKIATAVEDVNFHQKRAIVRKMQQHFDHNLKGLKVAVWGLAFKPRTDDTREAPALSIIGDLLDAGAEVCAFDPEGMESFQARMGDRAGLTYRDTNYATLEDADALVICTEWSQFRQPDFARMARIMRRPVIFDGRNLYDLDSMRDKGFVYHSIGRPSVSAPVA